MPIPESSAKKVVLVNLGARRELMLPLITLLQNAVSLRLEDVSSSASVESWSTYLANAGPPDLIFICFAREGRRRVDVIKKIIQGTLPQTAILFVRALGNREEENDLFYWDGLAFNEERPGPDEDILTRRQLLLPLMSENLAPWPHGETVRLKQFIGRSSALVKLTQIIPKVARSDASVMISGETGTGKELVAQAIHSLSIRSQKPFVAVNCGAIPSELVENELFGHEAGAFTGASSSSVGVVRDAEGGILFLDEVDCLPLSSQAKLLRFLQEKEYRPLGARKTLRADVRVVSASSAKFNQLIEAGSFRRDLFYRLHVVLLLVPSLRERKEDIPLLARHLVEKYAKKNNLALKPLSAEAIIKLMDYRWPGNIRELENVIERSVIFSERARVDACDIELPKTSERLAEDSFKTAKAKAVKEFETEYLQKLLVLNEGNVAKAAKAAGKHRRAFFELLHKHHINVRHLNRPEDEA